MLRLNQDMAMGVMDMEVMVMADLMVDMDTAEDTMAREALMLRLLLSQDTMVVMDMEVMVDMVVTDLMEVMDMAEVTMEREMLMLSQDMVMADIMVVMDMADLMEAMVAMDTDHTV